MTTKRNLFKFRAYCSRFPALMRFKRVPQIDHSTVEKACLLEIMYNKEMVAAGPWEMSEEAP
jgi:hypothetical protein